MTRREQNPNPTFNLSIYYTGYCDALGHSIRIPPQERTFDLGISYIISLGLSQSITRPAALYEI
jgi:hypothetical protein